LGILGDYPDLIREQFWKRISRPLEAGELSWKLEPTQLRECRISWPTDYLWEPAGKWYEQIRRGLGRFIRIERRDIPQPAGAILVI